MAEKLDDLPDEGKVVIVHPRVSRWKVEAIAEREGCDWIESNFCPPGEAFVMDVDEIKRGLALAGWRRDDGDA